MATKMFFDRSKNTISQWVENYNSGLFDKKNDETFKLSGWISIEDENEAFEDFKIIAKAINLIIESGSIPPEKYFVTLKQVPFFGCKNGNYSSIIISQELNSLPIIMISPSENNSELFLINNKHKVVGTLEDIKCYLSEEFKL
jgi:hypothetical protein